jgi:hypothetical protein
VRVRRVGLGALLTALLVLCVAAPALAVGPRPGATYDVSSRAGTLAFSVSRAGTRFTLGTNNIDFGCRGGATAPLDLQPTGPIRVARNGTFSARIPTDKGTPFIFSGHFARGGRAAGRMSWHGSGSFSICGGNVAWTGHVRPRPPRRVRFVGTTSRGTRVSFYQTIERHPVVGGFNFGTITATCPDGSTEPKGTNSVYTFHVSSGHFSGGFFTTFGEAGDLSGHFSNPTHASGTVGITGRDDCSFSGVTWNAHRAP